MVESIAPRPDAPNLLLNTYTCCIDSTYRNPCVEFNDEPYLTGQVFAAVIMAAALVQVPAIMLLRSETSKNKVFELRCFDVGSNYRIIDRMQDPRDQIDSKA